MYDQLLEWCSERAEGTLTSFRETYEWLDRHFRAGRTAGEWALAAFNLQVLGHIELDWPNDRWAITPPVLSVLDHSGGLAALTGARPRWLMHRLENLEEDPEIGDLAMHFYPYYIEQRGAPTALILTLSSEDQVAELCAALSIRFERRVTRALRHVLPSLDSYLVAGERVAPPPGVEPQRLDVSTGKWVPTSDAEGPGAYQYPGYGRKRYFFRDETLLAEADRGVVTFAELRRVDEQVIFYRRSDETMIVPARMRLPLLAARCAVLQTGLLPQFTPGAVEDVRSELGPLNCYVNIPPEHSDAITGSLGQTPILI